MVSLTRPQACLAQMLQASMSGITSQWWARARFAPHPIPSQFARKALHSPNLQEKDQGVQDAACDLRGHSGARAATSCCDLLCHEMTLHAQCLVLHKNCCASSAETDSHAEQQTAESLADVSLMLSTHDGMKGCCTQAPG
jgi:hypothetical protein